MNQSYYFKALCQAAGFNIVEAPAKVRENPEDMTAYLVHKHIEGDTKTADVFYRVCEDFASDRFAVFPGAAGPVSFDDLRRASCDAEDAFFKITGIRIRLC